jgi:antitoxin VapB
VRSSPHPGMRFRIAVRVGCLRRLATGVPDEWPSQPRKRLAQNPAYRPAGFLFPAFTLEAGIINAAGIYIISVYHLVKGIMLESGIAKIFMHGRSQAVRLPRAFRLPGDRVRVRRVEGGILLEPMEADAEAWFAVLDRFADVPFMEEGRNQPKMPEAGKLFE